MSCQSSKWCDLDLIAWIEEGVRWNGGESGWKRCHIRFELNDNNNNKW